ncbi:MAG TPA: DUF933 domain-containing protein [Candidatus Omnitrophota bacterium]|nr:DUF933 domain-containing protein [Candidatus Omnitrophota bacterium]
MKVAVYGIPDFPFGKKNLPDERLDQLKDLFRAPKIVYISIEFLDESRLPEADGIICMQNKKTDLVLLDLEIVERRLNQIEDEKEKVLFLRCQAELEKEIFLNAINLSPEEKAVLANSGFNTMKPVLVVSNDNASNHKAIFKDIYALMGYISFYSACNKEVHAWSIKNGTKAVEAAGVIHSDLQRGFIKAEVVSSEAVLSSGGINQAKSKGAEHLEDKEYIVKDGDIISVRFNV